MGQVSPVTPDLLQCPVISLAILPKIGVNGENMQGVETTPVKLPKREKPAGPSVAIGKWMDILKTEMQYGG